MLQVCDKTNYKTLISWVGNLAMILTCQFIGPAPFFNLPTEMGVIIGMAGLGGTGYALVLVSTFSRAHSEALRKGFSDDIETYLMISGAILIHKYHF